MTTNERLNCLWGDYPCPTGMVPVGITQIGFGPVAHFLDQRDGSDGQERFGLDGKIVGYRINEESPVVLLELGERLDATVAAAALRLDEAAQA